MRDDEPTGAPAELHVTVLKKKGPLTGEQYRRFFELASDESRARAERFRRRSDGENTLLGEALAKAMLHRFAGIGPDRRAFARDENQKPFLAEYPGVFFNVSHSGEYVACAVAPLPVGIDVQVRLGDQLKLARRFFTENEYAYIRTGSEGERPARFCRVWAMKESYIKRDGKGLGILLNSFDVLALQRRQPGLFHEIPLEGEADCSVCCEIPRVGSIAVLGPEELLSRCEYRL